MRNLNQDWETILDEIADQFVEAARKYKAEIESETDEKNIGPADLFRLQGKMQGFYEASMILATVRIQKRKKEGLSYLEAMLSCIRSEAISMYRPDMEGMIDFRDGMLKFRRPDGTIVHTHDILTTADVDAHDWKLAVSTDEEKAA